MAKVVICGRPNVGKSTLFNALAGRSLALVHDRPGVTRDWVGTDLAGLDVELLDTAGMAAGKGEGLAGVAWDGSLAQIREADLAVLVVDCRSGLLPQDSEIAAALRRALPEGRIVVAVNKAESIDASVALSEFHALGLRPMLPVSAAHGHGVAGLRDEVRSALGLEEGHGAETAGAGDGTVRIAIMGRPNVGKSTLANRLLGRGRMIVSDVPGTTVDSVEETFSHKGRKLELVDTAGIRRKARIVDSVETRSARRARDAAEAADVILFMVDASEGVVHQDQLLANLVAGYGRATVVILNKSDLLSPQERRKASARAKRELPFMEHSEFLLASVGKPSFRPGRAVGLALEAHAGACRRFAPSRISRSLQAATESNNPPRSHGKRPSLRYAHQAGTNPPLIVIHGRHVDLIKEPYLRYLAGRFSRDLGYAGAPLHIRLKESSGKEARRRQP